MAVDKLGGKRGQQAPDQKRLEEERRHADEQRRLEEERQRELERQLQMEQLRAQMEAARKSALAALEAERRAKEAMKQAGSQPERDAQQKIAIEAAKKAKAARAAQLKAEQAMKAMQAKAEAIKATREGDVAEVGRDAGATEMLEVSERHEDLTAGEHPEERPEVQMVSARRGESLRDVAARAQVPVERLQQMNVHIADVGARLATNQQVMVPPDAQVITPVPKDQPSERHMGTVKTPDPDGARPEVSNYVGQLRDGARQAAQGVRDAAGRGEITDHRAHIDPSEIYGGATGLDVERAARGESLRGSGAVRDYVDRLRGGDDAAPDLAAFQMPGGALGSVSSAMTAEGGFFEGLVAKVKARALEVQEQRSFKPSKPWADVAMNAAAIRPQIQLPAEALGRVSSAMTAMGGAIENGLAGKKGLFTRAKLKAAQAFATKFEGKMGGVNDMLAMKMAAVAGDKQSFIAKKLEAFPPEKRALIEQKLRGGWGGAISAVRNDMMEMREYAARAGDLLPDDMDFGGMPVERGMQEIEADFQMSDQQLAYLQQQAAAGQLPPEVAAQLGMRFDQAGAVVSGGAIPPGAEGPEGAEGAEVQPQGEQLPPEMLEMLQGLPSSPETAPFWSEFGVNTLETKWNEGELLTSDQLSFNGDAAATMVENGLTIEAFVNSVQESGVDLQVVGRDHLDSAYNYVASAADAEEQQHRIRKALGGLQMVQTGLPELTPEELEQMTANAPMGALSEEELQNLGTDLPQPPPQAFWNEGVVGFGMDEEKFNGYQTQAGAAVNQLLPGEPGTPPTEMSPADVAAALAHAGIPAGKIDPGQLMAATNFINNGGGGAVSEFGGGQPPRDLDHQRERLSLSIKQFMYLNDHGAPTLDKEQLKAVAWSAAKIPGHAIDNLKPHELQAKAQEIAGACNAPGDKEFKVGKHDVKLSIGETGSVDATSTKKPSIWGKIGQIASIALSVASFIPPIAPFARAVQAGIAVYKAIKNKSILGAVAAGASLIGAGGAVAGKLGRIATETVDKITRITNGIAGAVRGIQGIQQGGFGGIITGVGGVLQGVGGAIGGDKGMVGLMNNVGNRLTQAGSGIGAVEGYINANRAVKAAEEALAAAQASGDPAAIAQAQEQLDDAKQAKRGAMFGAGSTFASLAADSFGRDSTGDATPRAGDAGRSPFQVAAEITSRTLGAARGVNDGDFISAGVDAFGAISTASQGTSGPGRNVDLNNQDQGARFGLGDISNLADGLNNWRTSSRAEREAKERVEDLESQLAQARNAGDSDAVAELEQQLKDARNGYNSAMTNSYFSQRNAQQNFDTTYASFQSTREFDRTLDQQRAEAQQTYSAEASNLNDSGVSTDTRIETTLGPDGTFRQSSLGEDSALIANRTSDAAENLNNYPDDKDARDAFDQSIRDMRQQQLAVNDADKAVTARETAERIDPAVDPDRFKAADNLLANAESRSSANVAGATAADSKTREAAEQRYDAAYADSREANVAVDARNQYVINTERAANEPDTPEGLESKKRLEQSAVNALQAQQEVERSREGQAENLDRVIETRDGLLQVADNERKASVLDSHRRTSVAGAQQAESQAATATEVTREQVEAQAEADRRDSEMYRTTAEEIREQNDSFAATLADDTSTEEQRQQARQTFSDAGLRGDGALRYSDRQDAISSARTNGAGDPPLTGAQSTELERQIVALAASQDTLRSQITAGGDEFSATDLRNAIGSAENPSPLRSEALLDGFNSTYDSRETEQAVGERTEGLTAEDHTLLSTQRDENTVARQNVLDAFVAASQSGDAPLDRFNQASSDLRLADQRTTAFVDLAGLRQSQNQAARDPAQTDPDRIALMEQNETRSTDAAENLRQQIADGSADGLADARVETREAAYRSNETSRVLASDTPLEQLDGVVSDGNYRADSTQAQAAERLRAAQDQRVDQLLAEGTTFDDLREQGTELSRATEQVRDSELPATRREQLAADQNNGLSAEDRDFLNVQADETRAALNNRWAAEDQADIDPEALAAANQRWVDAQQAGHAADRAPVAAGITRRLDGDVERDGTPDGALMRDGGQMTRQQVAEYEAARDAYTAGLGEDGPAAGTARALSEEARDLDAESRAVTNELMASREQTASDKAGRRGYPTTPETINELYASVDRDRAARADQRRASDALSDARDAEPPLSSADFQQLRADSRRSDELAALAGQRAGAATVAVARDATTARVERDSGLRNPALSEDSRSRLLGADRSADAAQQALIDMSEGRPVAGDPSAQAVVNEANRANGRFSMESTAVGAELDLASNRRDVDVSDARRTEVQQRVDTMRNDYDQLEAELYAEGTSAQARQDASTQVQRNQALVESGRRGIAADNTVGDLTRAAGGRRAADGTLSETSDAGAAATELLAAHAAYDQQLVSGEEGAPTQDSRTRLDRAFGRADMEIDVTGAESFARTNTDLSETTRNQIDESADKRRDRYDDLDAARYGDSPDPAAIDEANRLYELSGGQLAHAQQGAAVDAQKRRLDAQADEVNLRAAAGMEPDDDMPTAADLQAARDTLQREHDETYAAYHSDNAAAVEANAWELGQSQRGAESILVRADLAEGEQDLIARTGQVVDNDRLKDRLEDATTRIDNDNDELRAAYAALQGASPSARAQALERYETALTVATVGAQVTVPGEMRFADLSDSRDRLDALDDVPGAAPADLRPQDEALAELDASMRAADQGARAGSSLENLEPQLSEFDGAMGRAADEIRTTNLLISDRNLPDNPVGDAARAQAQALREQSIHRDNVYANPNSTAAQRAEADSAYRAASAGANKAQRDVALDRMRSSGQFNLLGNNGADVKEYRDVTAANEAAIERFENASQALFEAESAADLNSPEAREALAAAREELGEARQGVADAQGQGRIHEDAQQAAEQLVEAMDRWGTDENAVYRALAGRSPDEIAAIKLAYEQRTGRKLADDIDGDMDGADLRRAQSMLDVSDPESQRASSNAYANWLVDEADSTLGAISRGAGSVVDGVQGMFGAAGAILTGGGAEGAAQAYQSAFESRFGDLSEALDYADPQTAAQIRDRLRDMASTEGWIDRAAGMAVGGPLVGSLTPAEQGQNELLMLADKADAVSHQRADLERFEAAASDQLAMLQGRQPPPTEADLNSLRASQADVRGELQAQQRAELEAHDLRRANVLGDNALKDRVLSGSADPDALARAYASQFVPGAPNPNDTDAARHFMLQDVGANMDSIELDRMRSLATNNDTRAASQLVAQHMREPYGANRKAVADMLENASPEQRAAIMASFESENGVTLEQFNRDRRIFEMGSERELSGEDFRLHHLINDTYDPVNQAIYATRGGGTYNDTLRTALGGESGLGMSADELAQFKADYEARTGEKLEDMLFNGFGEVSGSDERELRVLLEALPEDNRGRLQRSVDLQRARTDSLGSLFSGDEKAQYDATVARAEAVLAGGGEVSDADLANLNHQLGVRAGDFVDSANAVWDTAGTVAAVGVGVAITVGTGFTGAPIGAGLIAAAAGAGAVAQVGVEWLGRGGSYSWEDMGVDALSGAVEAATAVGGEAIGRIAAQRLIGSMATKQLGKEAAERIAREAGEEAVEQFRNQTAQRAFQSARNQAIKAGQEFTEQMADDAVRQALDGITTVTRDRIARHAATEALTSQISQAGRASVTMIRSGVEGMADGALGGGLAGGIQTGLTDGTFDDGFLAGMGRVATGAGMGLALGAAGGAVLGAGMARAMETNVARRGMEWLGERGGNALQRTQRFFGRGPMDDAGQAQFGASLSRVRTPLDDAANVRGDGDAFLGRSVAWQGADDAVELRGRVIGRNADGTYRLDVGRNPDKTPIYRDVSADDLGSANPGLLRVSPDNPYAAGQRINIGRDDAGKPLGRVIAQGEIRGPSSSRVGAFEVVGDDGKIRHLYPYEIQADNPGMFTRPGVPERAPAPTPEHMVARDIVEQAKRGELGVESSTEVAEAAQKHLDSLGVKSRVDQRVTDEGEIVSFVVIEPNGRHPLNRMAAAADEKYGYDVELDVDYLLKNDGVAATHTEPGGGQRGRINVGFRSVLEGNPADPHVTHELRHLATAMSERRGAPVGSSRAAARRGDRTPRSRNLGFADREPGSPFVPDEDMTDAGKRAAEQAFGIGPDGKPGVYASGATFDEVTAFANERRVHASNAREIMRRLRTGAFRDAAEADRLVRELRTHLNAVEFRASWAEAQAVRVRQDIDAVEALLQRNGTTISNSGPLQLRTGTSGRVGVQINVPGPDGGDVGAFKAFYPLQAPDGRPLHILEGGTVSRETQAIVDRLLRERLVDLRAHADEVLTASRRALGGVESLSGKQPDELLALIRDGSAESQSLLDSVQKRLAPQSLESVGVGVRPAELDATSRATNPIEAFRRYEAARELAPGSDVEIDGAQHIFRRTDGPELVFDGPDGTEVRLDPGGAGRLGPIETPPPRVESEITQASVLGPGDDEIDLSDLMAPSSVPADSAGARATGYLAPGDLPPEGVDVPVGSSKMEIDKDYQVGRTSYLVRDQHGSSLEVDFIEEGDDITVYIQQVRVSEEHRKRGLAKELYRWLGDEMKRQGIGASALDGNIQNPQVVPKLRQIAADIAGDGDSAGHVIDVGDPSAGADDLLRELGIEKIDDFGSASSGMAPPPLDIDAPKQSSVAPDAGGVTGVTVRGRTLPLKPNSMLKMSRALRRGRLNQLGLGHTDRGHSPFMDLADLRNRANQQGASSKWASDAAMLDAAARAHDAVPSPEAGKAYYIDIPEGAGIGFETGTPQPLSPTRARVFFRPDGEIKTIHPFVEGMPDVEIPTVTGPAHAHAVAGPAAAGPGRPARLASNFDSHDVARSLDGAQIVDDTGRRLDVRAKVDDGDPDYVFFEIVDGDRVVGEGFRMVHHEHPGALSIGSIDVIPEEQGKHIAKNFYGMMGEMTPPGTPMRMEIHNPETLEVLRRAGAGGQDLKRAFGESKMGRVLTDSGFEVRRVTTEGQVELVKGVAERGAGAGDLVPLTRAGDLSEAQARAGGRLMVDSTPINRALAGKQPAGWDTYIDLDDAAARTEALRDAMEFVHSTPITETRRLYHATGRTFREGESLDAILSTTQVAKQADRYVGHPDQQRRVVTFIVEGSADRPGYGGVTHIQDAWDEVALAPGYVVKSVDGDVVTLAPPPDPPSVRVNELTDRARAHVPEGSADEMAPAPRVESGPVKPAEGSEPSNVSEALLEAFAQRDRAKIAAEMFPADVDLAGARGRVAGELADFEVRGEDGVARSLAERLKSAGLDAKQSETLESAAAVVYDGIRRSMDGLPDGSLEKKIIAANWSHLQMETARLLDSAKHLGLEGEDLVDTAIASLFSDAIKPSPGRFPVLTHDEYAARAWLELADRIPGMTEQRAQDIHMAILEHQGVPPTLMSMMMRGEITDRLAKAGTEMTPELQASLDSLVAKIKEPYAQETLPSGRVEYSNLEDVPGRPGHKQLALTDQERELLGLVRGDDSWPASWHVPNPEALESASYRKSFGVIFADFEANYLTGNGAQKIVSNYRGFGTPFEDSTVDEAFASVVGKELGDGSIKGGSFGDAREFFRRPELYEAAKQRRQRLVETFGKVKEEMEGPGGLITKLREKYAGQPNSPFNEDGTLPFWDAPLEYPNPPVKDVAEIKDARLRAQIEAHLEIRQELSRLLIESDRGADAVAATNDSVVSPAQTWRPIGTGWIGRRLGSAVGQRDHDSEDQSVAWNGLAAQDMVFDGSGS